MAENYWNYIERAYDQVSIYDGADAFESGLKRFSPSVGDLLAAHWFLSEMSNGGIAQFFSNPTAVVAERAVLGFENLGLTGVAEALKRSIAKAGSSSEMPPPELFEEEEKAIYLIGGTKLDHIYDKMDAYAKKG